MTRRRKISCNGRESKFDAGPSRRNTRQAARRKGEDPSTESEPDVRRWDLPQSDCLREQSDRCERAAASVATEDFTGAQSGAHDFGVRPREAGPLCDCASFEPGHARIGFPGDHVGAFDVPGEDALAHLSLDLGAFRATLKVRGLARIADAIVELGPLVKSVDVSPAFGPGDDCAPDQRWVFVLEG
jgi:hypothetical protein